MATSVAQRWSAALVELRAWKGASEWATTAAGTAVLDIKGVLGHETLAEVLGEHGDIRNCYGKKSSVLLTRGGDCA